MIVDDKQGFGTEAKEKKSDHNPVFLKIAAEQKNSHK